MKLKHNTQPITNILPIDVRNTYLDEYMHISDTIWKINLGQFGKNDLIKFHKQKLGRQLTCFNGKYRYWVWEGSVKINEYHTATWRIFISNTKGICFEVDTGREEAAMICWKDYRNKIGI